MKKQLCQEGFIDGIWALCHIKIRGTVIPFEKALWRITSLRKHTVIVRDCSECASQPTSADLRYRRYRNVALTLKWTGWGRITGRYPDTPQGECARWEDLMDVCSTVFIDLKLHPGKTLDTQELLMRSTNHLSSAASNSLFYPEEHP